MQHCNDTDIAVTLFVIHNLYWSMGYCCDGVCFKLSHHFAVFIILYDDCSFVVIAGKKSKKQKHGSADIAVCTCNFYV